MAAPRASVALNVARAGLTVAAACALARVFAGRSWLFAMVIAAVAPAACLVWAERHRWPAVVRVGVLTLAGVWLSALVADPSSTVAGVPTRATIVSLGHALGRAPHTLRTAIVPVPANGSALVLAFVSVFVAAALTHWIGTALDAPIGAFAPSIALFIVVSAVGEGGWVLPTALYALASLAYLLALAQHDLVARRTWFHAAAPRTSRLAAGGAAVGIVAIATALAAGPSVPGAGGSPLLDYKGGAGGHAGSLLSAPPPIISLRDKLTLGPTQELFTVQTQRAAYWRVIALDWFSNGNAWGINKAAEVNASQLGDPGDLPRSQSVHQRFHIEQLDPHWLPAAYRPVGINLTAARVVPDSLTLLIDSKQEIGDLLYDVDSQVPTPTTEQLERAPFSNPHKWARDLQLPSDFPDTVRELARSITARARGPYERAVALVQFFRTPHAFTYSFDTNLGDTPNDLTQFLTKTRKGFCEQFAASYAALARAVGIPSRVAVGYQPGTLGRDGLYHVTNHNAHAWPEVWIEGAGWLPFEPTPAFSEPTLGLGTGGPKPGPPGPAGNSTTTSSTTPSATVLPTVAQPDYPGQVVTPVPAARHHHASPVLVGFFVVAGAIVLGTLGFLATAAFTLWRRGRRRRHDRDPRRRVLGAWNEALDHLSTAGVPPRPSATSLEYALRFAPAHGAGRAGGAALMQLARLQSAAMFAADPPSDDDAEHAWEQADTIKSEVQHNIARSIRWRRRLRQLR
jgi:hypothetical protein